MNCSDNKQTIRASLLESVGNIAIGFFVSVLSQMTVFPIFGIHTSRLTDLEIGAIFTAISLVRSFTLRRVFEALRVKGRLR